MRKQLEKQPVEIFMETIIEEFLEKFPNKAKTWAEATDEIMDISRASREYLEEYQDIIVEPLNFKQLKSPAKWNTEGKASIMGNFNRMTIETKKAFFRRYSEWFLA